MSMLSRFAAIFITLSITLCPAFADTPSEGLERKIQILEKVLDEVLVQSDNISVTSRSATRGLSLEGYGALFIFDGSLGESLIRDGRAFFSGYVVAPDKPTKPGDDEAAPRAPRARDEYLELGKLEDLEKWKKEQAAKKREHLSGLEAELIDTMLDYGATLSDLDNDAWLTVVAFLGENMAFLGGQEEQRLQLQVKMSDLRQFMAGSLTREQARKKVMVSTR